MLKFGGTIDNSKKIQTTKYIFSTVSNNSTGVDGAELIPIDFGGRLVTQTIISVNELGKQLLKAASEGNLDEIKTLLTKGAPFTADWLGTSPLHLAAQNNHLDITETLLRAGISKDARTKVDKTPLHLAAFYGHLNIVDALVKHNADLDCRDMLGMTPLHWAIQNGHIDVVVYLINHGSQLNLENKFGLTPLMIAQQTMRTDIEKLINTSLNNASTATQNLVIQLATEDGTVCNDSQEFSEDMVLENSNHESIIIPLEPDMMTQFQQDSPEMEEELSQTANEEYFLEQDQESIEAESEQLVGNVNMDSTQFSDSLKLLQEHGITMLQTDENEDTNILNSVMESGHSVVLTDIGKEVLNSVKQSEQLQPQQLQPQQQLQMNKKIVQVTADEFMAMANGCFNGKNVFKQLKLMPVKNPIKRIVMRKNKIIPVTSVTSIRNERNSPTNSSRTDMELVMTQLIEARKTIEEYKIKLHRKEEEAERYKRQLKMLISSN